MTTPQAATQTTTSERRLRVGSISPRRRHAYVVRSGVVAVVVALIALWWLLVATRVIDPLTLPEPPTVVRGAFTDLRSDTFVADLNVTLIQIGLSFAFSLVLGAIIGLLSYQSTLIQRGLLPWLAIGNSIPIILLYPVAILLLGIGTPSIVALSMALACLPIADGTYTGLSGVREVLVNVVKVLGGSRWAVYRTVLFPGAIGTLAAGLRLGLLMNFVGVVAVQFILSGGGLGYRLKFYYDNFQAEQLYGLVLVIVAIALVFQAALAIILRLLSRSAS